MSFIPGVPDFITVAIVFAAVLGPIFALVFAVVVGGMSRWRQLFTLAVIELVAICLALSYVMAVLVEYLMPIYGTASTIAIALAICLTLRSRNSKGERLLARLIHPL